MNGLSLCSGTGADSLGLRLAIPDYRTVCYVEVEAYPQDILLARMADGVLARAPIWGDLRCFDPAPWRGLVDLVHGGYPCQPFSVAGRRRGADDPRHLWPDIARIIAAIEPEFCFFENVAGHLRLGFDVVAQDLVDMGYRVAAGLFTAAEVGAPHRRERLYILARRRQGHSVADTGCQRVDACESGWAGGTCRQTETVPRSSSPELGDAIGARRSQARLGCVVDTSKEPEARGGIVGDASSERLAQRLVTEIQRGDLREQGEASGTASLGIWPPGPSDRERWAAILERRPDLAPALADADSSRRGGAPLHLPQWRQDEGVPDTDGAGSGVATSEAAVEPALRRVAHGAATRTHRLKACGNAVVPSVVALAWRTLQQTIDQQGEGM